MDLATRMAAGFARLAAAINAVDAKTGGGGGGAQQVFVQETRPITPGPWAWLQIDAAGNPVDYIINDGNP